MTWVVRNSRVQMYLASGSRTRVTDPDDAKHFITHIGAWIETHPGIFWDEIVDLEQARIDYVLWELE